MATKKDVKIEINIAGELILLTVPFDDQDHVRECEKVVNNLFSDWRTQFPKKTTSELMAMLAYQFAYAYSQLTREIEQFATSLSDVSAALGSTPGSTAPGNPDYDK